MGPSRADLDAREQLRQLCAELRRRLLAGEDCRAETLLDGHPLLASDPDCALELILTEFVVRRELGQRPAPEEWYARFPQWRERLARQFQIHDVLAGSAAVPSTDPEEAALTEPQRTPRGARPGPRLGRYELLEEVGRGGMGVVYKARDTALGRVVAVKTVRGGVLADAGEVERFHREARAAARWHHPHIVPIYDSGEDGGHHYFVMRFVGGGTVAADPRRFAEPGAAAELVEKLARAVHYAHEQGVVHRDLKPANVLLDEQGEPWVSDFGLAKFLDANVELTERGQVVGTPAYMAPEQAAGQTDRVTPRSDVWALGVLLYELLAGRRPFAGDSRQEVLHLIQTADPPRLRRGLDRTLEAVVLKCLQRAPERRYRSAAELADDLGRWRAGLPTAARPEGWPRRAWRALRRRPALVAGAGLLAAAVLAAVLVGRPPPPADEEAAIRQELDAGREVPLLKPDGWPRRHQWRLGTGSLSAPSPDDGVLLVNSWEHDLVELVHDPRGDSYRYRADVRQENTRLGEVGLCLLLTTRATDRGRDHCFVAFTFADLGKDAGRVSLNLRRGREPSSWGKVRGLEKRVPPVAGKWRTLEVEVTPEGLTASWEGEPLGRLGAADLRRAGTQLLEQDPAGGAAAPTFPPRGALGLFTFECSASYRRVVVQRLR